MPSRSSRRRCWTRLARCRRSRGRRRLIPAAERTLRLAPFPSTVATSYLVESAVSRDSSRSNTVSSCSSCSAWTIVAPTWPAPMTKMFTVRRLLRSPPGDPIAVGYRDPRCGPCSSSRRIGALVTACAAGAAPDESERAGAAQFRPRAVLSGLEEPVYVDRAAQPAEPALRRRAARRDPRRRRRQAARRAVPRHQPAGPLRRRAGALLGRVPPAVPAEPASSTSSTRTAAATRGSSSTARTARERCRGRRDGSSSATTRTATTTAASSRSGPTAASTSRSATEAREATRRTDRRTCAPCSGSCSRSTSPRRGSGSRRSACATRGASPSTAPTATSTSATSARASSRRSTICRARSPGLENYGWDVYEGSERYESKAPGPGKLVFPVAEYSHDDGCSVTGGYVYRGSNAALRGRYIYGDYCSGIVWSFKIQDGKARGLRREPFRVDGLTSFGEDAAGELYAVSHGGTIYRLTP